MSRIINLPRHLSHHDLFHIYIFLYCKSSTFLSCLTDAAPYVGLHFCNYRQSCKHIPQPRCKIPTFVLSTKMTCLWDRHELCACPLTLNCAVNSWTCFVCWDLSFGAYADAASSVLLQGCMPACVWGCLSLGCSIKCSVGFSIGYFIGCFGRMLNGRFH